MTVNDLFCGAWLFFAKSGGKNAQAAFPQRTRGQDRPHTPPLHRADNDIDIAGLKKSYPAVFRYLAPRS
jgi:hypothetical protein